MNTMKTYVVFSIVAVCALLAQGITNGNFDFGRNNGWTEYSAGNYAVIGTAQAFASASITPPVTPRSGQYMARLGGFNYEVNSITQTVALPNTTPLFLKFYFQDRNDVGSACDALWGGQIRVYVAGQLLFDNYICYYSQKETWTPGYFDLSAAAGQTVQIKFQADAAHSSWSFLYLDDFSFTNTTGVAKENGILPVRSAVVRNYPNPFNPSTIVQFAVPVTGKAQLKIFNCIGQEVATLFDGIAIAGENHQTTFNGEHCAGGVYIALLVSGGKIEMKRMVLLK